MEELNDKLIEINDTLKKWRKLNDSYVAPLSRIMSSLNESTYTFCCSSIKTENFDTFDFL